MKNLILTTTLFVALSGAVHAKDNIDATVTEVWGTETRTIPQTERVCYEVVVPVYGRSSASTGEALGGAIIGGVIGNQFGNGSGKDVMTVLGAIVGADVANKRGDKQVVGHRLETRCEKKTTYTEVNKRVYKYSVIKFFHNGVPYSLRFQK